MRLGTFLLGGIVGAAAAVYVSRNKPSVFASFSDNLGMSGRTMNKINSAAKNMWNGVGQSGQHAAGGSASQEKEQQWKPDSSSASASSSSSASARTAPELLEDHNTFKVQELIDDDPQLKAQVNEILAHQSQDSSASSANV